MCYEFLAADSTRGGILVAWDQNLVSAEAPSRQRFTLSLKLAMKLSNVSFLITAVYGPNEDNLKISFLGELVDCQPAAGTALAVSGGL